jgi:hypothetical protein
MISRTTGAMQYLKREGHRTSGVDIAPLVLGDIKIAPLSPAPSLHLSFREKLKPRAF